MKVTVKILILILAVSLAIGGVMIFAKTKVAPPQATEPIDQFSEDLIGGIDTLGHITTPMQQDSLFAALGAKTRFYVLEDKISQDDGNAAISQLGRTYTRLFLKKSMEKFSRKSWPVNDFEHMLRTVAELRSFRDFDNSRVLPRSSLDSLALVERIISDYKHALGISRHTTFNGIDDAQATIIKARQCAKDKYLSNCTSLVKSLNNVKPALAASHYKYVCASVESLSKYRTYNKSYYEGTLVPHVQAVITAYDEKAAALYGGKRNIADLKSRGNSYISSAYDYYD